MALAGLVALVISSSLSGCSVWQSEGRKFLDKNGLEFTVNQLNNFSSYQQQDCSREDKNQASEMTLTGEFRIVAKDREWDLRTFSQEQNLEFLQHLVHIQAVGTQRLLYCHPIVTKVPTHQLSAQQIQEFFSSP